MGSRASQLRNRQQVHESSAGGVAYSSDDTGHGTVNNGIEHIKTLKYEQGSDNNINNNNNNDDADMVQDALSYQKTLHAAAATAEGDTQQANGNSTNGTPASKGPSLQDRASSLAQRIRRSSSIKKLLPTFVAGRRKVSK
jgi:hypothetical protein